MSVMLYKEGGKHKLHGGNFDYTIVDELEVDQALEDGWFKTTTEAKEANTDSGPVDDIIDSNTDDEGLDDNAVPTREEMEAKAKELGIRFPANIKDATLLSKINEALAE